MTLNDAGDADTGPNNLQNYPLLTAVTISSGSATITGTLNSTPATTFRLEFFSNPSADDTGFGEGQTFLGFTDATTDAAGNTSYSVTFPVAADAKSFAATATDAAGNTSEFSPAFRGRLLNISSRMRVLTDERVLIGGFIITGADSKKVIIRGLGPSLSASGVSGVLQDPTLELRGNSVTMTNDNWKAAQQAEIEATGIPPTSDAEAAIVATLAPGAYTALVAGKDNTTGVGLVEVYDLDQSAGSKLANISTRGFVDTGGNVHDRRVYHRAERPRLNPRRRASDRTLPDGSGCGGRTRRPDARTFRWERSGDGDERQLERIAAGRNRSHGHSPDERSGVDRGGHFGSRQLHGGRAWQERHDRRRFGRGLQRAVVL